MNRLEPFIPGSSNSDLHPTGTQVNGHDDVCPNEGDDSETDSAERIYNDFEQNTVTSMRCLRSIRSR